MNVASRFVGEDMDSFGNRNSGTTGNVSDLEKKVEDLTDKMSILMDVLMQQKTTEINLSVEADKRAIFQGSAKYINQELNANKNAEMRLMGKKL